MLYSVFIIQWNACRNQMTANCICNTIMLIIPLLLIKIFILSKIYFIWSVQDLEQYATSYSGLMRIERLQFIAEHCPQLRVEALKMALTFVQRTFNVDTYEEIHRKLTEATRLVDDLLSSSLYEWKIQVKISMSVKQGSIKLLNCAICPYLGMSGTINDSHTGSDVARDNKIRIRGQRTRATWCQSDY